MGGIVDGAVSVAMLAAAAGITLWMAGAIYYDACGGTTGGRLAAAGWVVGVVVAFAIWQPPWQPFAALVGVFAAFLVWWLRQEPSHDRDWDPAVAVLPRAIRDGDAVTIEN